MFPFLAHGNGGVIITPEAKARELKYRGQYRGREGGRTLLYARGIYTCAERGGNQAAFLAMYGVSRVAAGKNTNQQSHPPPPPISSVRDAGHFRRRRTVSNATKRRADRVNFKKSKTSRNTSSPLAYYHYLAQQVCHSPSVPVGILWRLCPDLISRSSLATSGSPYPALARPPAPPVNTRAPSTAPTTPKT